MTPKQRGYSDALDRDPESLGSQILAVWLVLNTAKEKRIGTVTECMFGFFLRQHRHLNLHLTLVLSIIYFRYIL